MRGNKIIFATLTASALLAASVSAADARGFRHGGPGPVLGLLGGVIVGAATIATLPFVILADAVRPSPPPRDYYGQDNRGYGPPQGSYGYGYGPPPADYGPPAPPPPPQGSYGYGYGPPAPPPPRYYRGYGPPPGYYGYGY